MQFNSLSWTMHTGNIYCRGSKVAASLAKLRFSSAKANDERGVRCLSRSAACLSSIENQPIDNAEREIAARETPGMCKTRRSVRSRMMTFRQMASSAIMTTERIWTTGVTAFGHHQQRFLGFRVHDNRKDHSDTAGRPTSRTGRDLRTEPGRTEYLGSGPQGFFSLTPQ